MAEGNADLQRNEECQKKMGNYKRLFSSLYSFYGIIGNHISLVGVLNCTTTLEKVLAVSYKAKQTPIL